MVEEIRKYDKNFTEQALYKYVEDIFNALIQGIMNYNISSLYNYIDENIYNKYLEIIEGYKKMKIKRVFSNVIYKNKMINSCSADENTIIIKILMITKYKDYFLYQDGSYVDNKSPQLIEKGHYITFSRDLSSPSSKYRIIEMDAI